VVSSLKEWIEFEKRVILLHSLVLFLFKLCSDLAMAGSDNSVIIPSVPPSLTDGTGVSQG
jgi:hypothetical protein